MPDRSEAKRSFEALADTCSNAGRWGPDDEKGTLNLITSAKRLQAVGLVRSGEVVALGHPLDCFAPQSEHNPLSHQMMYLRHSEPYAAIDVIHIELHGLGLTHLDALGHVYHNGTVYNGRYASEVVTREGLTFASVASAREGIVTRGVLLDVEPMLGDASPAGAISPGILDRAERRTGVMVEPGDAVIVHSGLDSRQIDRSHRTGLLPECAVWFRERDVAVFAGDCIDYMPSCVEGVEYPFHVLALAVIGLPMIDNARTEDLVAAAKRSNRNEFLFLSAPLDLRGATGSPVNPLCVF